MKKTTGMAAHNHAKVKKTDVKCVVLFACICVLTMFNSRLYAQHNNGPDFLEQCNVTWDSPSKDISGTMPLGNGDIALNVWVEENSDLLLLIGKSDAWDENATNLKLAKIRIRLSPNPFLAGLPFKQSLLLENGSIEITGGPESATTTCRIWVDANQPVIRIETWSDKPVKQEVILETWRNEEYTIEAQVSDLFKNLTGPDPYSTITYPDTVLAGQNNRIVWYHHNRKPAVDGYDINMDLQGMSGFSAQVPHPLLNRIFGAAILGENFISAGPKNLQSKKASRHHVVSIYPLTLTSSTPEEWRKQLDLNISAVNKTKLCKSYANHCAWWKAFWLRSWINISDTRQTASTPDKANAEELSRAYQLCRFMNACASRGAQPIKFNGSLFTVGTPENPDYRLWGGPGFWHQNERLIYWPMLAAGDYDLMEPWFRMYREALPFSEVRCRKWFQHDGAVFGETIYFWGAEASGHYGWTPFEKRATPNCECSYLTYHWQNGLENLAMMLDYFSHTNDTDFLKGTLLPHARGVTTFYDLHYQRDSAGTMIIAPAASLETWHWAINPLPEIAGLKYLMPQLLELPDSCILAEQKSCWQRLLNDVPELPSGFKSGLQVLFPADTFSRLSNVENPELYAVFPYRLFGVGKQELPLARNTYDARDNRQTECWSQNDTQGALLGLTDETCEIVCKRASANQYSTSRFPAFWNKNNDWNPDVDNGGNLQLALQYMLMQTDGNRILLFPAWPKDWNANFKLHAPGNTTVECVLKNGTIEKLVVTPASRLKDVEIMLR